MTAACSNWRALFSVEDVDDEDLLEADWTHPSTRPSALPAGALVGESRADGSRDAQQSPVAPSAKSSVPDSSECGPVKGLRSLANSSSSSVSHPAASEGLKATSSTSPRARSNLQPSLCNVLEKDTSTTQDDFDDWDVDLDELDECVPQKPPVPDLDSDLISPAKRTRLSDADADTPASSLRGICSTTPKSVPQQSSPRSTASPLPKPLAACRFASPGPASATCRWRKGAVTPRAEHAPLFQAVSPAPVSPRPPRPLHMPVLTNHLVQLVSAASKTPQRPRGDSVRPKTRRFPGPAGALPQQISGRSLDDIVVAVPQTPAHGAVARLRTEVPSSQGNDDEEFSAGPWATMKLEMGLDERNPSCFLNSYSIVMVLRKAALRQLSKNKVPNMAVVLKSILHTHADAKAVFRDPTGKTCIKQHIGEKVRCKEQFTDGCWKTDRGELKSGAVLLLKQVGVFSPSNRNHYLNVTPNNLLRIYPPGGAVHGVSQRSQPVLDAAGSAHCDTSTCERGPVSQMELRYDEEEDEEEEEVEQSSVEGKPVLPDHQEVQSSTRLDRSQDTHWDADDLDQLLGDLPVESYTT